MRALAVLPVKRFSAAKQRLAPSLGPRERRRMAEAMLADVLDRLSASETIEAVLVVSGDRRARAIAAAAGTELLDDPRDEGHSQAAVLGIAQARERGSEAVALLPGDCPLLDPDELDRAVRRLREVPVVVVPDRHGEGTNGLLMRPPGAIAPAFGAGSRRRHLDLAKQAGLEGEVEEVASLALDLDTPDDLRALTAAVGRADGDAAPRTRGVLADLGLLGVESRS